jgi:WD40 repeat protein
MTTRSRTRSAIVEAEISDSEDDSDIDERPTYAFDGNIYPTYEEMVTAKRKRNADWMEESGLLKASSDLKEIRRPQPVQNGLVRKKKAPVVPGKRRKSNRLAGVVADGDFVEDERGGKFRITTVAGGDTGTSVSETKNMYEREQNSFYNNRINDGSDLSMTEAVDLCGEKWVDETSATNAMTFTKRFLVSPGPSSKSPTSVVADYSSSVVKQKAETDDVECNIQVAKVTPERIYSVACHPSRDSLIVGAGDKLGNVGLWNVDDSHEKGGDVYLFRPHTRPICCLEWTSSGSNLLTASYDGSVRWFDAESQTFSQVFATYDSSAPFKGELGYGLDDEGSRNWVQYCTGDFRSNQEKCFFMSTSKGNTFHVDLRTKGSLTFHENLSEKKINTVR